MAKESSKDQELIEAKERPVIIGFLISLPELCK